MKWTDEEHNMLIKLKTDGLPWKKIAKKMTEKFNRDFTGEQCRSRWRTNRHKIEIPDYKETIEIGADGSHKSDRLLRMNAEQSKDVNYLLAAHGYDKEHWELVSARNNIWNSYSKQDGIMTMFASKITVKPRVIGFNFDKLLESIKKVPKVIIHSKYIPSDDKKYLLLPLFDMHFGISDYEYYKETQQKIIDKINHGYEEVLLICGQDMIHTDDFRGRTASGTEIGRIDVVKAWRDAQLFFYPIIEQALANSKKTKVIYSKGNHSETIEWTFVQMLKERYAQVIFDDEFKERKAHMLGLNLVGFNHGDKKKEDKLTENFATEFPVLWSQAKTRTVFTGHYHSERVIDKGGILIRRMPTRNKLDDYHDDNGYTTAHSRFQIHEYNYTEQLAIHYV